MTLKLSNNSTYALGIPLSAAQKAYKLAESHSSPLPPNRVLLLPGKIVYGVNPTFSTYTLRAFP